MELNTLKRNGWDVWHLCGALGMLALGVAVAFDAWNDILSIAIQDEESSHILLVPLVFLWLIWSRRIRLRRCRPTGLYYGPLIVAAGAALLLIGYYNAIQSFWHGGALLLAVGCVVCVVGAQVVKLFLPAFVALLFAVPIPGILRQQISLPLQVQMARVTSSLLEVLGSNVTRFGSVLSVNGVEVGIVEACNGLRMVFALVMVSYTFAFAVPLRWYIRLLIVIASPILAILCNVIRVSLTTWFYGYSSAGMAEAFHEIGGWCMLLVAFGLLFAIIRLLQWARVPVTPYTLARD